MPVDNGVPMPKPKTMPLQFKRGTDRAFKKNNPILLKGEPGYEWNTRKLKVGDGETRWNRLPYIGDHSKPKDGKSAYELWLEAGNQGSLEDFLDSLVGEPGKSTYEIWLSLGHEGTVEDFVQDITGLSAYEVWLRLGNQGTEQDFIDSLKGESAYQSWLNIGHTGTEEDFIEFLMTTTWTDF